MVSPNAHHGPPRQLSYSYPHFADEETGRLIARESLQGEPARRELSAVNERPIIAVAVHESVRHSSVSFPCFPLVPVFNSVGSVSSLFSRCGTSMRMSHLQRPTATQGWNLNPGLLLLISFYLHEYLCLLLFIIQK